MSLALQAVDPGIDRHVGDRVGTGDEVAVAEPVVQHPVEPRQLTAVALLGVGDGFVRIGVEMKVLAEHGSEAAHLPEQPLQGLGAPGHIGGQEAAGLLGQIEQDRTRLEQRYRRLPTERRAIHDRRSRQIADYGGVVNSMPKFATFFVIFALANAGLPGTSGFVGEFMVILASFKANVWYAFLAALTLILGAAYTLWMLKRVVFGEVANDQVAKLVDLNQREFFCLLVLALLVLWIGLWPAPLIEMMDVSVSHLLQQAQFTNLK